MRSSTNTMTASEANKMISILNKLSKTKLLQRKLLNQNRKTFNPKQPSNQNGYDCDSHYGKHHHAMIHIPYHVNFLFDF